MRRTPPTRSAETRDRVRAAIQSLPWRERKVIGLYYYGEVTMKQIGAEIGVNESRVSQLHAARSAGCATRCGDMNPQKVAEMRRQLIAFTVRKPAMAKAAIKPLTSTTGRWWPKRSRRRRSCSVQAAEQASGGGQAALKMPRQRQALRRRQANDYSTQNPLNPQAKSSGRSGEFRVIRDHQGCRDVVERRAFRAPRVPRARSSATVHQSSARNNPYGAVTTIGRRAAGGPDAAERAAVTAARATARPPPAPAVRIAAAPTRRAPSSFPRCRLRRRASNDRLVRECRAAPASTA